MKKPWMHAAETGSTKSLERPRNIECARDQISSVRTRQEIPFYAQCQCAKQPNHISTAHS